MYLSHCENSLTCSEFYSILDVVSQCVGLDYFNVLLIFVHFFVFIWS